MDLSLAFLYDHASYAHWVIFSLFFLAALSLPISEDLLIITSALLASSVIPENFWKLYFGMFFGAYLSDFIPFGIGRYFGPLLHRWRWVSKIAQPERLAKVQAYYQKYGILTLLIGRFIPFGVRNCLFLTAGIGRMPLYKFALTDGVACLISTTTLFTITYYLGSGIIDLFQKYKFYNISIVIVFFIALIAIFWYKRRKATQTG